MLLWNCIEILAYIFCFHTGQEVIGKWHGDQKKLKKNLKLYEEDWSWKEAFSQDQADINASEDLYHPIESRNAYRTVEGNQLPLRLPFPIPMMSFEDKSEWVIEAILLNHKVI